ncbi:MAG: bifunctional metallophosphatase/5'-nucleotidase [Dysgonomonas sp.]
MKLKYICLALVLVVSTGIFAQKKIVILHTNDTHSRIEALPPTDSKYPNTAGVVNRKAVIDSIKAIYGNVLLLDAGDFVQGTPYFNLFKGRAEADMMNYLKYDAATIGNHEFDYGLDTMKMIFERLNFPIVNCNYDFSKTVLKDVVKPYTILKKFGLKIGIVGVGADPKGLIQEDKYEGMTFLPIIESTNKYAEMLKNKEKCDMVICLSHIGFSLHPNQEASGASTVIDQELAQKSRNIDLIIGGHSHTYMQHPVYEKNMDGKDVMIFQCGKNATYIGKIEVELDKIK